MNITIKKIQDTIKNTQFEGKVYVAGGFVRDHFMNRDSKDIDLVVVGLGINGGIELAYHLHKMYNTSTPVVFKRFGTAQIVLNGEEIEIVAARKETYNFKDRMPIVSEGNIEDDVNRRDFTINSIFYNISNESFVDLKGGIIDIQKGIIRTTSDPNIIFAEDPLRIMRAIRFSAQLGFDIERETWTAIVKYVPWLKNISNERIKDEFNKILVAEHFVRGIDDLYRSGILGYMIKQFNQFDDIQDQGKFHTKNLFNHTLEVMMGVPATVEHRLAALLHDVGKVNTMTVEEDGIHFYQHQFHSKRIAKNFMVRYKYTNEQIEWVTNSISMHMSFIDMMKDSTIRKMVNQYGKEQFLFFTDLGLADSKRPERKAIVQSVVDFVKTDNYVPEQQMKMPVNGDMIMEHFNIKPGKEVGRLLAIEKDFLFEFPEASIEEIWEVINNNK
ncbi:MAG: Poly(A) polymerase I precursor [Parcubacteria group bacterium ADurb.Bin216]|nr:MAG: Poly(A) polymerase I precursor [Parcubacteria group bacterium ADurb.Bin216]